MENKQYVITSMTPDDMTDAIQWAKDQGWNPGLEDANCFYQTDPKGFFVGKLGGVPIAYGSAVIYDEHFAFCGFYMVKPKYRGQGYGMLLTEARLKYIGSRNAGLDGVLHMCDKYARIGYKIAHNNARYRVESAVLGVLDAPHPDIVPVNKVLFDALVSYDAKHFPVKRAVFLKHWLVQKDMDAIAFVQNGELKGYGVIRRCYEGYKIGPLFAENELAANAILIELIRFASGAVVYLDCPENNPGALNLARRYGFEKVFETARMYLKKTPDIPMKEVFGITSFELG